MSEDEFQLAMSTFLNTPGGGRDNVEENTDLSGEKDSGVLRGLLEGQDLMGSWYRWDGRAAGERYMNFASCGRECGHSAHTNIGSDLFP